MIGWDAALMAQVFIKASWHVGEPHLSHYTKWFLAHARGEANTGARTCPCLSEPVMLPASGCMLSAVAVLAPGCP